MTLEPPNIASLSIASSSSGYIPVPYADKEKQFDLVVDEIDKAGFIPENLIEQEAKWFYNELNIDDVYFAKESPKNIVSNIHALYAAKLQMYASPSQSSGIHYYIELEDHAVYFDSSDDNAFEKRIDEKYLNNVNTDSSYRVESFKTEVFLGQKLQILKLYFVYKNVFPSSSTAATTAPLKLSHISDKTFSSIATDNTKEIYTSVIKQYLEAADSVTAGGPIIRHFQLDTPSSYRIVIGYRQNTTLNYASALSSLLSYYNLTESARYIEQFSNGITIISSYITVSALDASVDLSLHQVIKESSLLYCIPNNDFATSLYDTGMLSLQECVYAHCGAIFVAHFLNRLGPEYVALQKLVINEKSAQEVLTVLKDRLRSETYTPHFIKEIFVKHKDIISKLYRHFADIHYSSTSGMTKTLSYQHMKSLEPIENDEHFEQLLLDSKISNYQNQKDALVLRALYTFNKSILKTNFYSLQLKVALSFRLHPTFLPIHEYPEVPFGLFFVVGAEFRGFHIRFRDIARGGIRIVQSRNKDTWDSNMRTLIDENYGLASTQQRKNKDIPEGGSKGVILLNADLKSQLRATAAFEKYIDAILDLLLVDNMKKSGIVDLYGEDEILFMGPDEGTSHLVDWATEHAKNRGAPWWKSFFTGKSPKFGGIPHDEYGMTTLSVRAYVEEIYKKKDCKDKQIFKVQTGGPGGDLGSNEILLSSENETYLAVVDGPAVAGDPNGLDKSELERLAHARLDISHFDKSKLSDSGFLIIADDSAVELKNYKNQVLKFPSGVAFRNVFHLKFADFFEKVDLFVPCGGRPASINITNVDNLIDKKTNKSMIPYIVEGANLFITQPAKIELENAGCILFKDASTNKGGVTSSSKEVLASLAFNDEQFLKYMCIQQNEIPSFYKDYVKEVQSIITKNARLEFHALWKLHESTKKTFSVLSDELSVAINVLADSLAVSDCLWEQDTEFRDAVIIDFIPKTLLEQLEKDSNTSISADSKAIISLLLKVPETYLRRMFATQLAGDYVYLVGLDSNPAKFLEFVSILRKKYIKAGLLKY